MSELKKKCLRYEILADVEDYLLRQIESVESDSEWRRKREDGEEIPDWQKEQIQKNDDKIAEIREVIKALAKL